MGTIQVDNLNLLKIAPGGHVGRFCIWTEAAFRKLDDLYGTWRKASTRKAGWNLPQPKMSNTDLTSLLKRAPIMKVKRAVVKTNPLKNIRTTLQLNPYAAVQKKNAELTATKNLRAKAVKVAKATGQPIPADPMAKRAAKVKK